jgi:hypothetical protein
MSEPPPAYTTITKRGNRITYELTPAEAKIIEWIRNNCHGRWVGTAIFDEGTNTLQLFDGKKAGIIRP